MEREKVIHQLEQAVLSAFPANTREYEKWWTREGRDELTKVTKDLVNLIGDLEPKGNVTG